MSYIIATALPPEIVGDQRGSGRSPFGPTSEQAVGLRHAIDDSTDPAATACGVPAAAVHRLFSTSWDGGYHACPRCKAALMRTS